MHSGSSALSPTKREVTWTGPPPLPNLPGLLVELGVRGDENAKVLDYWLYDYQDASPPGPTQASITRKPDPEAPEDKDIDNLPPEDEDEDGESPPPPPSTPGKYRYYTHPTGAWRVLVPRTWGEPSVGGNGAWDQLAAPDNSWGLRVVRRTFPAAKPASQALQDQLATEREHYAGPDPTFTDVNGQPGAGVYLVGEEGAFWSLWIAHNGELYNIRAVPGAAPARKPLQDLCLQTMRTIEYLGGVGGGLGGGQGGALAGAFGSQTVFDATSKLTQSEADGISLELELLARQQDLKLAVVLADAMPPDQLAGRAGEYRQQLVEDGLLPAESGVLLYAPTGRGFSRTPGVEARLPLEVLKAEWYDSGTSGLAELVTTHLRRVRERLGVTGVR